MPKTKYVTNIHWHPNGNVTIRRNWRDPTFHSQSHRYVSPSPSSLRRLSRTVAALDSRRLDRVMPAQPEVGHEGWLLFIATMKTKSGGE